MLSILLQVEPGAVWQSRRRVFAVIGEMNSRKNIASPAVSAGI
jgi:hypothetical protein